jgi:putative addiction module killer protein
MKIVEYKDKRGSSPFAKWLKQLDPAIAAGVNRYVRQQLKKGNFKDAKPLGKGLFEMRVDVESYRVYFGRDGNEAVLLGGC